MNTALILITTLVMTLSDTPAKPAAETKAPAAANPWEATFTPPASLETPKMKLEPLGPAHAELDHAAFMSCIEFLKNTLGWDGWPRPMTVEEDRKDLENHEKEFKERKGYAFTVLSPDKKKCIGCVYINPAKEKSGLEKPAAEMAFWVTEEASKENLDQHLLESLSNWFQKDWPFREVGISVYSKCQRQQDLVKALGLKAKEAPKESKHLTYVWKKKS